MYTRWRTFTVSYDKGVPIHQVESGEILVNVTILLIYATMFSHIIELQFRHV